MSEGALTPAGWPRPVVAGWPVPWVSPDRALGVMNDGRYAACASGAVCAVCGQGYQMGAYGVALVKVEPGEGLPDPLPADGGLTPMDNAVLHGPCARLAVSTCPALVRLREEGALAAVLTPGNAAVVVVEREGEEGQDRVHGWYSTSQCRVVTIAAVLADATGAPWPLGPRLRP
jgi:hypothetical protein